MFPAGSLPLVSLLSWALVTRLWSSQTLTASHPFFPPYFKVSQILASFLICCPKDEWHWTPGHRTSHYLVQWEGETWDGGGRDKKSPMEAGGNRNKGTKASAVHWERQGTCCCLSMQVMAGSCSQYLTQCEESELFLLPDLMPKLHSALFSSLCWPMGNAPHEHSYLAEGTGWTECPLGQLRSCFLFSPAPCTAADLEV